MTHEDIHNITLYFLTCGIKSFNVNEVQQSPVVAIVLRPWIVWDFKIMPQIVFHFSLLFNSVFNVTSAGNE